MIYLITNTLTLLTLSIEILFKKTFFKNSVGLVEIFYLARNVWRHTSCVTKAQKVYCE